MKPTRDEAIVILAGDEMAPGQIVQAAYVNHAGEALLRTFLPLRVEFGVCECHGPEPTWVVHAWDFDRQDVRSFSMPKFISAWVPLGAEQAKRIGIAHLFPSAPRAL